MAPEEITLEDINNNLKLNSGFITTLCYVDKYFIIFILNVMCFYIIPFFIVLRHFICSLFVCLLFDCNVDIMFLI